MSQRQIHSRAGPPCSPPPHGLFYLSFTLYGLKILDKFMPGNIHPCPLLPDCCVYSIPIRLQFRYQPRNGLRGGGDGLPPVLLLNRKKIIQSYFQWVTGTVDQCLVFNVHKQVVLLYNCHSPPPAFQNTQLGSQLSDTITAI